MLLEILKFGPIGRDMLQPCIQMGAAVPVRRVTRRLASGAHRYRSGPYEWEFDVVAGRLDLFRHAGVLEVRFGPDMAIEMLRRFFADGRTHTVEWFPSGRPRARSSSCANGILHGLDTDVISGKTFVAAFVRGNHHGLVETPGQVRYYLYGSQVPRRIYLSELPAPTDLHQSLCISPAVARHICAFV